MKQLKSMREAKVDVECARMPSTSERTARTARLVYVPVIHSLAEMGSAAEAYQSCFRRAIWRAQTGGTVDRI